MDRLYRAPEPGKWGLTDRIGRAIPIPDRSRLGDRSYGWREQRSLQILSRRPLLRDRFGVATVHHPERLHQALYPSR